MKRKFLILIFLLIVAFNVKAQEEVFEKIENKTWFENSGFAGTSIVFYRTINGLFKAIRQINGSGVPVIASEIYDIQIHNDTIYLLNGLNLVTTEKIGNYYYHFNKSTKVLYKNKIQLKILASEPILYTWTKKRKNFSTQINMSLLREISINKKEIYKESDLIQILKDK